MKVISRVVAYKTQCLFCGAFIEFDKEDIWTVTYTKTSWVRCPECKQDIIVSDNPFLHNHLKSNITEIFEKVEKETDNG